MTETSQFVCFCIYILCKHCARSRFYCSWRKPI